MATAAAAYVERRGWTTAHTVLLGLIIVAISVVGISLPPAAASSASSASAPSSPGC